MELDKKDASQAPAGVSRREFVGVTLAGSVATVLPSRCAAGRRRLLAW